MLRLGLSPGAEIVATAREMLRLGLVTGTSGNVSARDGELLVITASALPYEQMTVADLVALDGDGTVVAGEREPSSEWRVHVAVYAARPDAAALVHTHSEHATAWSERNEPLGAIQTTPYAPAGSDEIALLAVEALGDRQAVLLGRHGVLALGPTPAAALETCVAVEAAARRANGVE
jgi:L-fuculose-phosphate aldolase